MKKGRPTEEPWKPTGRLLAISIAGVLLGGFSILFVMANDAWVVVKIPSAPWSVEPSDAFEARLAAIFAVCFATGALATLFTLGLLSTGRRRRAAYRIHRIKQLEIELERVDRLVSSSRPDEAAKERGAAETRKK